MTRSHKLRKLLDSALHIIRKQMACATQNIQKTVSKGMKGNSVKKIKQYDHGYSTTISFKNLQTKRREGLVPS